jgi:hypothetical protein
MEMDGEIVGLHASNNGRACQAHDCCGYQVVPGDIVQFKSVKVCVDGKEEDAIKAVLLRDGAESCVVGFLPRNIVKSQRSKFDGHCAKVLELYSKSENSTVRTKDYRNKGMASFCLIDSNND